MALYTSRLCRFRAKPSLSDRSSWQMLFKYKFTGCVKTKLNLKFSFWSRLKCVTYLLWVRCWNVWLIYFEFAAGLLQSVGLPLHNARGYWPVYTIALSSCSKRVLYSHHWEICVIIPCEFKALRWPCVVGGAILFSINKPQTLWIPFGKNWNQCTYEQAHV